MAVRKYYLISRRERQKYRKKMMSALRKHGFSDAEILRIIDSVAGMTQSGKEDVAKALLSMLAEGAERQRIFDWLDTFREDRYPYTVK